MQNWVAKSPLPEALRVAKRSMLKKFGPRKAVPYYWAGFTRRRVCSTAD